MSQRDARFVSMLLLEASGRASPGGERETNGRIEIPFAHFGPGAPEIGRIDRRGRVEFVALEPSSEVGDRLIEHALRRTSVAANSRI